ncbi:MAG: ABC transporter permease subunit [Oscillospiraceae bacterium]|jgi:putative aldouronate transport system permease protein|nr:ABC transporter permease subunit [Oscillospiraceae bacterium]
MKANGASPAVMAGRRKSQRHRNLAFSAMAFPAVLALILFEYVPLSGLVLAFKNYNNVDGIFGSPWNGLDNFKFFVESSDMAIVLRNTIGYSLCIMLLLNLLGGMIIALLLYEVRSRFANRLYQTAMLLPDFLSWVSISFIAFLLLNPESGIMNQLLTTLGLRSIEWYNEAGYWPFIIVGFQLWKAVGMSGLYYYAALLNTDTQLFEAASLDGAGKLRQIWHISVPQLLPMASIVLITQMGAVLSTSFDMFYNLPMNTGALQSTTNVLSTHIVRGLQSGQIGSTAAIGLFQSVVGTILFLTTNAIIRKLSPAKAMF